MIGIHAQPAWRFLALISVLSLPACSSFPSIQEIAAEINATLEPSPIVFVPGDTLELKFPFMAELDQVVTVRLDGRVSFLRLDEVHVAGMNIEALDRILTKAYRDRGGLDLEQATITINLANQVPRNIVIMGEVGSPGVVPIEGGHLSLIEAFGKAGGPDKSTADLTEVVLIRWMSKEGRQRSWTIDARIDYWQSGIPILLQAHDILYVPNKTIDAFNIWVDQYIRRLIPIPGFVPI